MPPGERVYAVGDVHGEAGLLQRLLARIERDSHDRGAARTTLVLLGDVIDRGRHAADLLAALRPIRDPRLVILKGNHEDLLLAACRGDRDALDLWLQVGGRSTLMGFGIDPTAIDPRDLVDALRSAINPALVEWLDQLPTSWSSGDYFFAHAGIRPGIRLDQQDDDDLMWVRESFLSSRLDHGKVVVHGHSVERGVPHLGGNRIGLDTGAHEHRQLTALGLEGDRQWLLQESDPDRTAPANALDHPCVA